MIITEITPYSCSTLIVTEGINHRKAYINTAQGRTECFAECAAAENYDELLTAWGDKPTVEAEPIPEPTTDTESPVTWAALAAAYSEGVNEA